MYSRISSKQKRAFSYMLNNSTPRTHTHTPRTYCHRCAGTTSYVIIIQDKRFCNIRRHIAKEITVQFPTPIIFQYMHKLTIVFSEWMERIEVSAMVQCVCGVSQRSRSIHDNHAIWKWGEIIVHWMHGTYQKQILNILHVIKLNIRCIVS